MPFAGHPTVGTAIALHLLGQSGAAAGAERQLVLEEGVGPVPVTVRTGGGRAAFAQFAVGQARRDRPDATPSRGRSRRFSRSIADDIQATPIAPQNVSCGLPFLMVPLRSVDAVSRARVRMEKFESRY